MYSIFIYVCNGSTLLFSARCFPGAWRAMELHRSWVIWPKREVVGPSSGALVTPKIAGIYGCSSSKIDQHLVFTYIIIHIFIVLIKFDPHIFPKHCYFGIVVYSERSDSRFQTQVYVFCVSKSRILILVSGHKGHQKMRLYKVGQPNWEVLFY